MQQIGLISTCLVIGIVLRLTGRLPDNATKVLGGFVIDVALPAARLAERAHRGAAVDADGLGPVVVIAML